MFHYCSFLERRLAFAAYLRGSSTPKAQPSAATKARTKTNKADYPRWMRLRSAIRLHAWQFVLYRGCSPLLSRNRSCALAILAVGLAFFSAMCISQHERPPELVALVEALMLRRGVFQLKARLLKAVRSELQAAKHSGLTWRVIWGTLRDEGYPGGYQQFCKAANRVIAGRPFAYRR